MEASPAALESLADAVNALEVRVQTATGPEVRGTAYAPIVSPTHLVVDVADGRVIALLRYPSDASEQPGAGTLLNLGTAAVERTYRVETVEPSSDGLTRLRVALSELSPDASVEPPRSI